MGSRLGWVGGACSCVRLEREAQGAVGNRFWTSPTTSLRQQATTALEGKCRRLGARLAATSPAYACSLWTSQSYPKKSSSFQCGRDFLLLLPWFRGRDLREASFVWMVLQSPCSGLSALCVVHPTCLSQPSSYGLWAEKQRKRWMILRRWTILRCGCLSVSLKS